MYETNIAYPFLHKPRSPFSKNFTIIHPGNMSQKPGSINSSFALPTSQTQGLLSLSFKSPWTRPILSLSTVTVLLQAHSTFHLPYWSIFLKSLLPSRLALLQSILHVAARVRYVYISSPKDIFHCFLEKEEGRERNIYRREMRWLVASFRHPTRDSSYLDTGIVHARIGNEIHNPGVCPGLFVGN